MRQSLVVGLFLVMASDAYASDEYVNPRFCYRIVQPAGVSRVVPRADGSGITMELAGSCPGDSCVSIDIAAGYPRRAGDLPHAHGFYRALGWKVGKPIKRSVSGSPWITYPMSKDGVALDVHEYVRRRGEAAYVLVARYPSGIDARQVRRDVTDLLASWRRVSACL
jgi:hypothetical protein